MIGHLTGVTEKLTPCSEWAIGKLKKKNSQKCNAEVTDIFLKNVLENKHYLLYSSWI